MPSERASAPSRRSNGLAAAGSDGRWDAKIADFGLHATVDARNKSEAMQHM